MKHPITNQASLPKAPTGIQGLDEITRGGLPRGRPTLICGSTGCGKTLLAVEFLVRGAVEFGEPGVYIAFEETSEELAANVLSLGFDLKELAARNLLLVDHVRIDRNQIDTNTTMISVLITKSGPPWRAFCSFSSGGGSASPSISFVNAPTASSMPP